MGDSMLMLQFNANTDSVSSLTKVYVDSVSRRADISQDSMLNLGKEMLVFEQLIMVSREGAVMVQFSEDFSAWSR